MSENRTVKILDKAQERWDNGLRNITPIPIPDEFGMVKMRYQDLRKLAEERRKLGWASGVFDTLAAVGSK